MTDEQAAIDAARDFIRAHSDLRPGLGLILGSGLGPLADEVEVAAAVPYADIPGFPVSTVPGHAGRLLIGRLAGKPVAVMQGRFHYYEGYPLRQIVLPIRTLRALGVETLVITNAAGGLNPEFAPADLMLITDHINLMGANPLIGPNDDATGPRFPDMTLAYPAALRDLAVRTAREMDIPLRQGIYVAVSGPSFETPAERRMLRLLGGDAVGMSTVPEVIAASHAGMQVLGFSAIANVATGGPEQPPDSHEEVLATVNRAGERLVRLLRRIVAAL